MARQQNLGASGQWFVGEDKTIPFEVYDGSTEGVIIDVSAYALAFYMRHKIESDKKVLSRTTGAGTITITGVFNAAPATNTQRVNILVADTDTDNLPAGQYQYWLWRTDAGNETVLAHGDIELLLARQ